MTSRRRSLLAAVPLAALALALPVSAQAPPATAAAPEKIKPFETAQVTKTTWYGRFGHTNAAWIDVGDGVLLVDTAATSADVDNLAAEIKRTTKGKPVRWIVVTHAHQDNNGALASLVSPDVTVFVAEKAAVNVGANLSAQLSAGREVPVVGVPDHLALVFGHHRIELLRPKRPAHTDHDVVVWVPETGVAITGDLVNPGRCPMMSDPSCDPKGWEEALDQVLALQPLVLIPTHGDAAVRPDPKLGIAGYDLDAEVRATRQYIERMKTELLRMKKKNASEAEVAAQLRLSAIEKYCPKELDAVNALALYKRMTPQGEFLQPGTAAKPAARPAAKK